MHLLAQVSTPTDLHSLLKIFTDILQSLFPILIGAALMFFIFGLVRFISKSGDAKTHAEGRQFMIWGLIGLFVMIAFMGIVAFFYSDFGFSRPLGLPVLPDSAHPLGQQ
jgi:FtsH-binding integral membrane protein